jgi:hypothetical protein
MSGLVARRTAARLQNGARSKSYLLLPCAFLRAAQRAFMASESLRRPSGVNPPFFLDVLEALAPLRPPRRFAQRARAAAESLARVAADMVRRRPPAREERALEPPLPLKIPLSRFSNV